MLPYLKLICVDGIRDKVPANITMVPTLVLTNINKPLVCGEVFEWVNTVKSFNKPKVENNVQCVRGYTDNFLTHVTKDKDETPFFDINSNIEPIMTPSIANLKTINEAESSAIISKEKNNRVKQESFYANIFSNQHAKILSSYDDEFKKIKK